MARSLNSPEYTPSKDFDRGYDMYVNNIKEFNKLVKDERKIKPISKQSLLKSRKEEK